MTLEAVSIDVVRPETVGFSSARLHRIDDAFRRFVEAGKIAGAVSLVARHGKVVHFEATGFANLESRRPLRRDAIFRIASMTKPITCTAVMMLFEEGHFLLDDPIADVLPEFARTKAFAAEVANGIELADLERPITIRHLLMHTSGLTYAWPSVFPHPVTRLYEHEQIGRPDEVLAEQVGRLAALPLVHQPGAAWTYGHSHDVLGRLVEVISGLTFDNFLQQRLFGPLEMPDSGFHVPAERLDRLATVYGPGADRGLGPVQRADLERSKPPIFLNGGGGLVSTATDYARFCQMLLNGGMLGNVHILGRKTVELMTANQTGPNRPYPPDFPMPNGYGFGLGVRVLVDPAAAGMPSSIGEYGWSGAESTYFWIDPRERLFGVLMVQLEPYTLRYGWQFQSLAYQALID
jgi:CubicO group peptidase (beta-lactamase class C family)